MSAPTPEQLAWLREHSGLSIDREGRWLHEGELVAHAGIVAALWRGLDLEAGRVVTRIGHEWAYVAVEDAPFLIKSARWECGSLLMLLSGGGEEPLDPATLALGAEGVLRCRVRGGRFEARFSRAAQVTLGEMAEEEGRSVVVVAGGRRWPVR